jgi:hypothetical protein
MAGAAKPRQKSETVCLPWQWHLAISAADPWKEHKGSEKSSDLNPLVKLLLFDTLEARDVRDSLADLFERCKPLEIRYGKGAQRPVNTGPSDKIIDKITAVVKYREYRDTSLLVKLLRSDTPIMRDDVRDGLADLLERCQPLMLRQGKGAQKPVYFGPSDEIIEIIMAIEEYRERRESGDKRKRDEIAAEIARECKIDKRQLLAALRSEHGKGRAVNVWLRLHDEGKRQ